MLRALAAVGRRTAERAAAAGRHRQGPGAPADPGDRRSRPGRRVQRQHRARHAHAGAPAGGAKARRSRSSPSAARGATTCAANSASRIVGDISYAGKRRIEFADAEEIGQRITAMLDAGEIRRLHGDLQPLPFGDLADRHRAAADPRAAAAGRRGDRPAAAPATSSSRTRKPSWRACCRRRWRSRSTARCWKVPPASTARG